MKLAVLTGGGDVPGLNPAIKAVTLEAIEEGHEVVGFRRGWAGTLVGDYSPLTKNDVRTIDRMGGTFLHSSRTNPGKVKPSDVPPELADQFAGDGPHDLTPHVLKVLEQAEVDVVVPIGGDDTLSYGLRLHNEGVPVVAIPKTMDNDVYGTDYCLGFSTAVSRSVEFIDSLRTATGSHERIAVVELFGRNSGETSLFTAYVAGADRALISEVPFDIDRLAELVMKDKTDNPSSYAMVTISEGAQIEGGEIVERGEADAYGHRKLGGIGQLTGELLKEKTGQGIIGQQVAYLMRSGTPDALDRMVAKNYGTMAAKLVLSGTSGRMVALRDGKYTDVDVSLTGEGVKRVDVDELYDVDEYRPVVHNIADKPMFLY